MAENKSDSPSFSIDETMDLGIGNTELLHDLMEPETATSKVEDLQP